MIVCNAFPLRPTGYMDMLTGDPRLRPRTCPSGVEGELDAYCSSYELQVGCCAVLLCAGQLCMSISFPSGSQLRQACRAA